MRESATLTDRAWEYLRRGKLGYIYGVGAWAEGFKWVLARRAPVLDRVYDSFVWVGPVGWGS